MYCNDLRWLHFQQKFNLKKKPSHFLMKKWEEIFFFFFPARMLRTLGCCTQVLFSSLESSHLEKAPATGHLLVDNSLHSSSTYHGAPHITLMAWSRAWQPPQKLAAKTSTRARTGGLTKNYSQNKSGRQKWEEEASSCNNSTTDYQMKTQQHLLESYIALRTPFDLYRIGWTRS